MKDSYPLTGAPSPNAPSARDWIDSIDPVTGERWRRVRGIPPGEVSARVAQVREAQAAWAALPIDRRARVIDRFRERLLDRRGEVAAMIRREMGKPELEALAAEVAPVLSHARFVARSAPRVLRTRRVAVRGLAHLRKRVTLSYEPFGVVGVIAPWNYPFMLAAAHLLPALVAGNGVVLKPSELTSGTGELLASLLHDAGVPRELLQVLPGDGATGAALVAECDKVFFTGSESTGRQVAHACAERLIPCVLELGGSDPAIVLDDAVVDAAVEGVLWGRFSNCGQTCVAPKRLYVVDAVHDRFVAALPARVASLRVGGADPEVGPPVDARQHARSNAQLEDATTRGARVLAQATVPDDARYLPPTLLGEVPAEARALREETFGPLLPVIRVRDAEEAVRLANESGQGLSASVWGADWRRAEAVARRLEAGTVTVNDILVAAGMAEVPHGGTKASGFGRAHGVAGLEECARTRTVVTERFASFTQPWWFGYTSSLAAAIDAFLVLEHARSLPRRLASIGRALPLLRRLRPR